MDVMTATAVQEKSMTIFTIDSENNIAAHASASEVTDKAYDQFTSEKELAQLDVISPIPLCVTLISYASSYS